MVYEISLDGKRRYSTEPKRAITSMLNSISDRMNLCGINLILCFYFVIVVAYGIRSENFVVTAKLWYRLRTRVASGVFCVECLCGT